jgi:WD40 repeat protein
VAITPDGTTAVSAGEDRTLKVWDLQTGQLRRTMEGHLDLVTAVVITPDGSTAVSASWDKTLKVWDLQTDELRRTLEGHSYWVTGVAITADGSAVVSASGDKTLRVWDLGPGKIVKVFAADHPFGCCCVSPSGKTIVAGDHSGVVHFIRIENPVSV